MKISFNPLAGICLFSSTFFMNYKLYQVGVPDALVLLISVAYCLLFPWKLFSISKEGENDAGH